MMTDLPSPKDAINNVLHHFKIDATCIKYSKMKNMSFYDLSLGNGTKIKEIQRISSEIGLQLHAKADPIINPIMAEGLVRVQVVDGDIPITNFSELIKFSERPKGNLQFLLGDTHNGNPLWMDITKAPHLLVAGTTGSGKSTLLHTIIQNSFYYDNLNLILIDPKTTEFVPYEKRKNVKMGYDYQSTLNIFKDLYEDMEFRYSFLRGKDPRQNNFNKYLPYVMVVIDEFADLVLQDENKTLSNLLCRIAQKSRAAGIHMVLATQRPSVDIITGAIKANFPTRIACKVFSGTDSRVVLDVKGAESLVGRGDSLVRSGNTDLIRFQAAYSDPFNPVSFKL